ncbi:glycosyltransferase [Fibrobacter intestinalis]|uniref:Glycosyl transferase family 2 n=1 Tax=Fibrobacter intestinalis TaxID=28122 RepID=A0A1T4RU55_9BACT|nr:MULTISPECIES: glycosyltransferase [Fibrobacter]PBC73325.1 glycosyl transferase family 2 [Fibrobacter sp. NR9]SKA19534.1 Glycosyl transferase family 2 [Fibrobacter intestinalis]
MKKTYPPYSVLLSVYKSEHSDWLAFALDSMFAQTVSPAEVLLVQDGPLTSKLYETIEIYKHRYPTVFKTLSLPRNMGLGLALRHGVLACQYEYIARMDTDDYSAPSRIEEEFDAMFEKNVDMVGCIINEFIDDPQNVVSHRFLPETHDAIYRFAKKRTPIAHPSVLFKKSLLIKCGNYEDYFLAEDFAIFVNLLRIGAKGYNIQKPLVSMRVSKDFYNRRGGFRYLKAMLDFNRNLLRIGWVSYKDFFVRSSMNCIVCLMPNTLRNFVYRRFLRK